MWASDLPSWSFLVHRALRRCWAIVVQEEIACEQVQTRSPSTSVLVLGQEGPKLASFPEPLCACVSILKKAALTLLPSRAFNRSGSQRSKKL